MSDISKNVGIASIRVIKARRVEKYKLLALNEALVGFRLLGACRRSTFAHHPHSMVLTYMIQVNARLGARLHHLFRLRA